MSKIFEIEKEIFRYFPGMKIVVVGARDIPDFADRNGIDAYLIEGWKTAAKASTEFENPQSHPSIVPWVESMKNVGAPRKKFPSSIEAMVKRAGKTDEPFRISPMVDFYNALSLSNLVPAGGYDLDEVNDVITLRMSREGDSFCALDEEAPEAVPSGEVSYADSGTIITRHFIWKQSKHCLINKDTRNVLFVSEILRELPDGTAEKVRDDFVSGLKKYFGADSVALIMDENNPVFDA